jgi:hypothetical protein
MPSIPAIEYSVSIDAKETNIITKIQNFNIKKYHENIKNFNMPESRKDIRNLKISSFIEKLKEKQIDNLDNSKCIVLLLNFIIFLFNIFEKILNFVFGIISTIIDVIIIILSKIISLTIALITPIIKLVVIGFIAYFTIAALIDISFLFVFLLLILAGVKL